MSETTVAQAIQDVLQGMDDFSDADVTLSDWTVLDGSVDAAPYAVVDIADDFSIRWRTVSEEATYAIPVDLFVAFSEWGASRTALKTLRDNIRTAFDTSTNATAGLAVRAIRSGGSVGEVYDAYLTPEQRAEAMPVFLSQRIIIDCEEF